MVCGWNQDLQDLNNLVQGYIEPNWERAREEILAPGHRHIVDRTVESENYVKAGKGSFFLAKWRRDLKNLEAYGLGPCAIQANEWSKTIRKAQDFAEMSTIPKQVLTVLPGIKSKKKTPHQCSKTLHLLAHKVRPRKEYY